MCQHLDPGVSRFGGGRSIGRIQVGSELEPVAVGTLDDVEQHGAASGGCHRGKFVQVAGTAGGDAVWEFGDPWPSTQVHVLDLDPGIGPTGGGQKKVDAARRTVADFAPHLRVPSEGRDSVLGESLSDNVVRQAGVDAGEAAIVEVDEPPGVWKFAARVGNRLEPERNAGIGQAKHRPGICAMGGNCPAVFEHDVREESFIPAYESAADQGAGKAHRRLSAKQSGQGQAPMPNPTAAMLTIGDEILSGRTRDANLPHLAAALTGKGIGLREARIVADDMDEIVAAVNALRGRYDHVFTSGGIGPTHDDITADAIARAFGVGIDVREDARKILATNYADPERELNEARLRMARIPGGAVLIDNPVSKAPGFSLENVHVMAGVPAIFAAMVEGLLPRLTGGRPLMSRSVRVDRPEGDIAGPLRVLAEAHPRVSIGSYPFNRDGKFGSNLVARSDDPTALDAAEAALWALAEALRAS